MTKREFLNAVIETCYDNGIIEYAEKELEKMDLQKERNKERNEVVKTVASKFLDMILAKGDDFIVETVSMSQALNLDEKIVIRACKKLKRKGVMDMIFQGKGAQTEE